MTTRSGIRKTACALLVPAAALVMASCHDGDAGTPATPQTAAAANGADTNPATGRSAPGAGVHGKPNKPLELTVPPEVKARWKAVELSVTSRDGGARQATVPVGGDLRLGKSDRIVHVVAFLPSFQMTNSGVTSRSSELDNPAVLVRLSEREQTIAQGWIFQKLPDFNTFRSDEIGIELRGANAKK